RLLLGINRSEGIEQKPTNHHQVTKARREAGPRRSTSKFPDTRRMDELRTFSRDLARSAHAAGHPEGVTFRRPGSRPEGAHPGFAARRVAPTLKGLHSGRRDPRRSSTTAMRRSATPSGLIREWRPSTQGALAV